MKKEISPLRRYILQTVKAFQESMKNLGPTRPQKRRNRHERPIHHGSYPHYP